MQILDSVSSKLSHLRQKRGLGIADLAQRCGIAQSTLSLIESGQGHPSIETVWAIANALDVPFASLLPDEHNAAPSLGDAKTAIRLIERSQSADGASIETYSMSIEPGHTKESAGHPSGVREKVVVTQGPMLTGSTQSPQLLNTGEVYAFDADTPHVYGALSSPVHAMVFIEYPARGLTEPERRNALDWPATPSGWEDVRSMAERLRIEVADSLVMRILRLRGCTESAAQALHTMHRELREVANHEYRWPVQEIIEVDPQGPFIAVLPQRYVRAFLAKSVLPGNSALARRAMTLASLAEARLSPCDAFKAILAEPHDSWTLEPLACACALQNGHLRLPSQLQAKAQRHRAVRAASEAQTRSSRTPLAHDSAFELLHPAYARQVVAMAQDIVTFVPEALHRSLPCLDVGTGAGIAQRMLQELLPQLHPTAIASDPLAYASVQNTTRERSGLCWQPGGLLERDHPPASMRLITSVGASHQFNTRAMLEKAMQWLQAGGMLTIADEFLPPFQDIDSRHLALVRHHAAYLLDTAAMIEHSGHPIPDDADGALYRHFRCQLIEAVLYAQQSHTMQAVQTCRQLVALAQQAGLDTHWQHPIGAYVRFFCLELHAMVAGFDYAVERKTHVRQFIELATATGFDLLRQRRIYATHGRDEQDGGTHVISLRKPLS